VTDWKKESQEAWDSSGWGEAARELKEPLPFDTEDETMEKKNGGEADELAEMNERYAITKIGGKTRVVEFEQSAVYPKAEVPVFSTIPDFCAFHNNRKKLLNGGGRLKEVGLGRWWIEHPGRRQYDRVAFLPGVDDPNVLNLWRGFSVDPKPGNCDLYLAHLLENICRNNQEHYQYLIGWMANAVQHPGQRCETAIVIRGKEGTGKGIAARYFGELFGAHFRHISQPKHLTGHFNAHLQQTAVLFADEAFFAGDRAHEGILKALITEPVLLIEPKGVDPFVAQNTLHIIMSSNSDWVVPASAEARRFAVFDVNPAHMQDQGYFKAIVDQMKNGGQEALLYMLQQYDLSSFNVRVIPQTEALAEQRAHSRRGIDRLIEIIAHDGALPSGHAYLANVAITSGAEKGEGFYAEAQTLVPDLKHMSSVLIGKKLRGDWGCLDWRESRRRGLEFPPLSELRARFEAKHGEQDWPEAGTEWTNPPDYSSSNF
jgi:hypothetical protein